MPKSTTKRIQKRPGVSIFFPCFNDEKSIGSLIVHATTTAKRLTSDYEIIVIDDASTDNSRNILKKLQKKYPHIRLICHKTNRGYGSALRSGFAEATKEYVFYTDGDGQYDPKELAVLWPLMTPDVHVVNGIKMVRQDPTYRVFIGNLYSFIARWFFWLPILDVDCDFRLIRRKLVQTLDLTSTSGSICIELVKKLERHGAVFRQVSIHHYERQFGESQFFQPERLLKTLTEVTLLWWDLMIIHRKQSPFTASS